MVILNLQAVRKSRGITQIALSELTGIPQPIICRFENGKAIPRLDQVEVLMKATGAKWDELITIEQ